MAKIHYNDKEFLVIELDIKEATKLNFGYPVTGLTNICVCGICNAELNKMYYVASLNEVVCEDCLEDFIANMTHYTDEECRTYEINHFNDIAAKLGLKERAGVTPKGKVLIYDSTKTSKVSDIYEDCSDEELKEYNEDLKTDEYFAYKESIND